MDVQGAPAASAFATPQQDSFPTLIDTDNTLGSLFGFRKVPNGVLVSADGEIEAVVRTDFDIRRPDTADLIERWLRGPVVSPADDDIAELSPRAVGLFREAGRALRRGDRASAIESLREAARLDPDNYIIRKQLWAVENPDRFYEGAIDFDWQKEQLQAGR